MEDDPWKNSNAVDTNASGRRGVPESSQEILQATQVTAGMGRGCWSVVCVKLFFGVSRYWLRPIAARHET